MGIFSIIGAPFEAFANGVKTILGSVITDPNKRLEVEAAIDKLAYERENELQQTLRKELEAKERIIVAELSQDDNFTKRARPSVIYGGLAAMLLNHVVLPWVTHFGGGTLPQIELPAEFWYGWSGIVATYAVGRSFEKRAKSDGNTPSKLVKLITG